MGVDMRSNGIEVFYVLTESPGAKALSVLSALALPPLKPTHSPPCWTPGPGWPQGGWYRRNLILLHHSLPLPTGSMSHCSSEIPLEEGTLVWHGPPLGTASNSGLVSPKLTHTAVFIVWSVKCLLLFVSI